MKRSLSTSIKAAPLQKRFLEPLKPFNNKASKIKIANTGEDPSTSIKEFMKKDFIKPLERTNIFDNFVDKKPIEQTKWTVQTVAKCKNPEYVPKFQQFEAYHFPQPKMEEVKNWKSFSLKTDNLTLRFDPNNIQKDGPKLTQLKSGFGSHTETYNYSWVPRKADKTTNNRSSVTYNILNNDNNIINGAFSHSISDTKLFNMKKGVAEISDLTRVTNPNYDPKFSNLYDQNKHIFKSFKGVFTQMYDASHRNGGISLPFRRGGNSENASPEHKPSQRRINSMEYSNNIPKSTRQKVAPLNLDVGSSTNPKLMPSTTVNNNHGEN